MKINLIVFLGILALGAVSACTQETPTTTVSVDATASDTVVVALASAPGIGPFGMSATSLDEAYEPDSPWYHTKEAVAGLPDSLVDLKVMHFNLQTGQLFYQLYRSGQVPASYFHQVRVSWKLDTLSLTPERVDQQVSILTARDRAGHQVLVFDTDNDEDFRDETAVVLPATLPDSLQRPDRSPIPAVPVSYQYFDGETIREAAIRLVVNPYASFPGIEQAYFVRTDEHRRFSLALNGITYLGFVRNSMTTGTFEPDETDLILYPENTDGPTTTSDGFEPYKIGETVTLGERTYRLAHITRGGDALTLVYEPGQGDTYGLRTGLLAPAFEATTLAGQPFRLETQRGKYVLIDFWGTWCAPCIGEVPYLKQAYATYSRDVFEIVGIATNDEADDVQAFLDEHGASWPQILQDEGGANDILNAYRVTGFPTTYLVGPDGKIVAKESALRGETLARTLAGLINSPE